MLIAVGILGLAVSAMGAGALILLFGYRARDLLVLIVLGVVTVFLTRWDEKLTATIAGRPYVGFHFFMLFCAIALAMARAVIHEAPPLRAGGVLTLLAGFSFFSIVSGLINGQIAGLGSVAQVLFIALAPMVIGLLLVDLVPRTPAASRRLRLSFLLLIGLFTPAMQITSSLAPDVFGAVLGWQPTAQSGTVGFVRGWSPLGGPIATGVVMVLAYGLAMHEVVGQRRRVFVTVLFLVGFSVLFTLSRAVLLMLVVFHIAYFWTALRRHPVRIVALCLLGFLVAAPVLIKLQERYSFERFLLLQDESTDIRASSAVAALRATVHHPLFGAGPGLLYEQIRTDWIAEGAAPAAEGSRSTVIEDELSALEPHNLYLLLTAEHGLPAALLFVGAFLLCWRRVRAKSFVMSDEDRSLASAWSACWLVLLLVLLTHSGPLINPQSAIFIWFFAFSGLHWRASMTSAAPYAAPELRR